jgi:hypothetical protein
MMHEMKVDRSLILEGTSIGLHQPHLPHSAATVTVEVEPAVVSCSRMHVHVRIISS